MILMKDVEKMQKSDDVFVILMMMRMMMMIRKWICSLFGFSQFALVWTRFLCLCVDL